MKRLLWLLPLLFVAVTSAAPTIPQQGAAALSSFLKTATDRGDVPGVVVAVVEQGRHRSTTRPSAGAARSATRR